MFRKNATTPTGYTQDTSGETELDAAAIHAVESQHGPFVRRNPNFKDLVADAKKQIIEAAEKNK